MTLLYEDKLMPAALAAAAACVRQVSQAQPAFEAAIVNQP